MTMVVLLKAATMVDGCDVEGRGDESGRCRESAMRTVATQVMPSISRCSSITLASYHFRGVRLSLRMTINVSLAMCLLMNYTICGVAVGDADTPFAIAARNAVTFSESNDNVPVYCYRYLVSLGEAVPLLYCRIGNDQE
ncbi:hypothetical protein K0M31_007140 [Melipona bicolor]|uniref:Uncharacterized protein n=1 Tax=Melipona bicolor TaxID=60889 RepID=A0AA40FSD6_9HYME|nr:hypothetical protein K0M31_007140 [Melipona bicolor]